MTCCALAAMTANRLGTPFEAASTMAVLSAGTIGLFNLILTCRPFTELRITLCAAMTAAFAGAVLLFPKLFFLHPEALSPGNWLTLAAVSACGVCILLLGSRFAKKMLRTDR